MKNKVFAIMMVMAVASCMIGCGESTSAVKEEATEVTQEAETPSDGEEHEETAETSEEAQEAGTEASAEKPVSDNPLMNADVRVFDVLNGVGTAKIGERACVVISPDELESLTPEQIYEFATEVVDGSGYNWFSIMTGTGEGLQFAGSNIAAITYGNLDEEGCITEDLGTWVMREGSYEFTAAEDY